MVSSINCQVSFPTVMMWSFVLLSSAAAAEGFAELDIKEGEIEIKKSGMEIKEYISLKKELAPKTYIINWVSVRKVVKALGVI